MTTEELRRRVNYLEKALAAFSAELRLAFRYIHPDAASSLTKSRIILEKLVVQLYIGEMGREPKKPLLGDMLADNQFTRLIERRILSRMNGVRDMGNLGPHGESVQASDAARVLDDLCEILDWYLERSNRLRSSQEAGEQAVAACVPVAPETKAPHPRPMPSPADAEVLTVLPIVEDASAPQAAPLPRSRILSSIAGAVCTGLLGVLVVLVHSSNDEKTSLGTEIGIAIVVGLASSLPGAIGGAIAKSVWAWLIVVTCVVLFGSCGFITPNRVDLFGVVFFAWIGAWFGWLAG